MTEINKDEDIHYICGCTKYEGSVVFWGHECRKMIWPSFIKVGQRFPIGMKLVLNLYRHLLDVYIMTQRYPKHEEKPVKLWKIPNAQKLFAKSPKTRVCFAKNGPYFGKYKAGHQMHQIIWIILIKEAMIAKNDFELLLAVK